MDYFSSSSRVFWSYSSTSDDAITPNCSEWSSGAHLSNGSASKSSIFWIKSRTACPSFFILAVGIPHNFDDDDSNSSCFYEARGVKCVQIRSFFWSVFSHIWAEHREIQYLFVFRPNVWKYGPEKTLYLDTFHAVAAFILAIFFTLGVVEKSSVLFCNNRSYFCFSFESKFILTSIYKSISWSEYGINQSLIEQP